MEFLILDILDNTCHVILKKKLFLSGVIVSVNRKERIWKQAISIF